MRIKYQVLRVYGSQQRYAPYPQEAAEAGKSVLTDFPETGDEATIIFGSEIPERISEYVKLSCANVVFFARKMFGGGESLPLAVDDAVEQILRERTEWFQAEKYEWFTSISIGREFEIDNHLVLSSASKYARLSYEFDELSDIQTFNSKAREELNSLETYLSFLFGSHHFENLIFTQVIVLDESGEFVFLFPKQSFSVTLGIRHRENLLDSSRFDEMLQEFKTKRRTVSRFKSVIRLRILFVREKDELKKFFYGFWSLEVLINLASKRARTQTEKFIGENQISDSYLVKELIKSLDKANVEDKFAVMQSALSYRNGEDLRVFKSIAGKRNNLAHGQVLEVESLPISEVQRLLDKYLIKALELDGLPEIRAALDT